MARPPEGGPGAANGPGDGTGDFDRIDALRRAVYAPGASAVDVAAYRQAVEARLSAPSRRGDDHDVATDVAPVPPERRAVTRHHPVALLAGSGIAVAVVVAVGIGGVAELLPTPTPTATPTASPRATPVALPADPSTTPTSSRDPTDRSTRFREGSGGAAETLSAPALAGTVLVRRSAAHAAPAIGTVDGIGGELQFALTCDGTGTVTLRLLGGATPPLVCRAGRPSPPSVVVAVPAHAVRYSISERGTAQWALAVGRTPRPPHPPASPVATVAPVG